MVLSLSPFVLWSQDSDIIRLKVEVQQVKHNTININIQNHGHVIILYCHGLGVQGESDYSFHLDLYDQVLQDDEDITCSVYETKIEIVLKKAKKAWWPRVTSQPQKPAWLKVDFDKWKSDDSADEEEKRDIMSDYPGMYDKLQKEEMGYRKEDIKKVYLIFYNMSQFIGFFYVLSVIGVRYSKYGEESMSDIYEHVGSALKFIQLMQFLEVMHPMFGYTKGGVIQPFIQVTGRALILFAMIEAEPRMQTKPVVFYLCILWCTIEIVRYPYYITQLYNKDIYLLTWLRYTLWIPLYPLGILCEGIVVLRNIPYFEETGRFTVSLPNAWNFAFHAPTAMRLYLLLLFLPGLYTMMMHMHRARVTKLSSYQKVIIKKSH